LINKKESWLKPDIIGKPEKTCMGTIKLCNRKEEKPSDEQVAITEEELKNILLTMRQL
jgi:hypothetical protein